MSWHSIIVTYFLGTFLIPPIFTMHIGHGGMHIANRHKLLKELMVAVVVELWNHVRTKSGGES
jgi:hypothetical protein